MLKNLMSKKRKSKGFTLIELVIVIAIIAILAAVAIPKYLQIKEDANVKSDIANAKTIMDATATLVANEKIDVPSTGLSFKVEDTGTASDPATLVWSYLNQKDYAVKCQTDKNDGFVVVITGDNDIHVETEHSNQIVPRPTAGTPWANH